MQRYLRTLPNRSREYPILVYWGLSVGLWIIAVATGVIVFLNAGHLELWKVALYGALLGAYLMAEKKAYRLSPQAGQRVQEPLRYMLAVAWWTVIFGSVLGYALWPISQESITAAGSLLMILGSGLRVWSVHTLGRYYSGHIETWTGQTVVQTGPYRVLRHPGYAGSMLQIIGLPLVLNAYGILLLSMTVAGLFIFRLLKEEAWLLENLPGYEAYRQRTWRLIPGVW